MSTKPLESIMSKGRELLGNGNAKGLMKVAGFLFAAGYLAAKVSNLEAGQAELKATVQMLVQHLLGTP